MKADLTKRTREVRASLSAAFPHWARATLNEAAAWVVARDIRALANLQTLARKKRKGEAKKSGAERKRQWLKLRSQVRNAVVRFSEAGESTLRQTAVSGWLHENRGLMFCRERSPETQPRR
jgi:hypothetical protein